MAVYVVGTVERQRFHTERGLVQQKWIGAK